MPKPWITSGSVAEVIDGRAEDIYRILSDVTSTGERSNECRSAAWLPDSPREPVVGARFRGYNRHRVARWSRVCEILAAEPGKVFAFRTVPERFDPSRRDSTTWRYDLVDLGDRTRVTHSYEITTPPLPLFKALYGVMLPHHKDMRPAMRHTLEALARATRGIGRRDEPGGGRSSERTSP